MSPMGMTSAVTGERAAPGAERVPGGGGVGPPARVPVTGARAGEAPGRRVRGRMGLAGRERVVVQVLVQVARRHEEGHLADRAAAWGVDAPVDPPRLAVVARVVE